MPNLDISIFDIDAQVFFFFFLLILIFNFDLDFEKETIEDLENLIKINEEII
jgi:hypothetical protein